MTPEQAAQTECRKVPPAHYDETIGAADWHMCSGPRCQSWRWLPLLADDAWTQAVQKAAAELKDTTPGRSKAARHVMENRAKYGLATRPLHGFCGRDVKPEVML